MKVMISTNWLIAIFAVNGFLEALQGNWIRSFLDTALVWFASSQRLTIQSTDRDLSRK